MGGARIQQDWCPYNRLRQEHRRTQHFEGSQQVEKRNAGRETEADHTWILDFQPPLTMRKKKRGKKKKKSID